MKPTRAGGKCVCVWGGGGGRTRSVALYLQQQADDGADRKDIIVVLFLLSVLPACKQNKKTGVHPELGGD